MNRRHIIARAALATLAPALSLRGASAEEFFTLEQRKGRWWLIKPDGGAFFSIGFHLCGACQRNKARRYGLLDEQEKPDAENVGLITAAN